MLEGLTVSRAGAALYGADGIARQASAALRCDNMGRPPCGIYLPRVVYINEASCLSQDYWSA